MPKLKQVQGSRLPTPDALPCPWYNAWHDIAARLSKFYVHDIYDEDDIRQELFIMMMKIYPKFSYEAHIESRTKKGLPILSEEKALYQFLMWSSARLLINLKNKVRLKVQSMDILHNLSSDGENNHA